MAARPTLDQAVSTAALKTLAAMTPEKFLEHLKSRGINSLEDLAQTNITAAKNALNSGLSYVDPDIFGVCYKFTVQPHRLSQTDINAVTKLLREKVITR